MAKGKTNKVDISEQDYLSDEAKKKAEEEERKRREREEQQKKQAEQVAANLAKNAAENVNPLEKGEEQNLFKIAQQKKEDDKRKKAEQISANLAKKAAENINPLEKGNEQNLFKAAQQKKEEEQRKQAEKAAANIAKNADKNPLEKNAQQNFLNVPQEKAVKETTIAPHQQNIPREDSAMKYMTAKQRAAYSYYLNNFGEERAKEYLDSIREELNQRQAEKIFSGNEGNIFAEYLQGAQAGLESSKEGYKGFLKMLLGEDKVQPTSTYEYLSQMAREDLASSGAKLPEALGGASLGQIGFDVVNTSANMLPSILLGTLGGGAVGAAAIGTSAAGNAYNEALSAGYKKDEAANYAILVGAAESTLGYLLGGIEATGGKISKAAVGKLLPKIDNALAKVAVNVGGKMASEFSEEYLQEILDPVFRNLALLEENEIDLLSPEAIYSGLLGALSAGGISALSGDFSVPVPFDGKAVPGSEAAMIAEKITEIENRPISEAEKAAKMEEIMEAVAGTTGTAEVIAEAEKFRDIHEQNTGEPISFEKGENVFGFKKYSEKQIENWQDSKRIAICDTFEKIKNFVYEAISSKNNKKAYFGAITSDLAQRINNETGIDVENYNCSLGANEIRKIFKDHGDEKTESPRGQRAITVNDVFEIPNIIKKADEIKLSKTEYRGKPAIEFIKNVDGSLITVIGVVSDKHLDLFVQTEYAGIKKGNLVTVIGEQAPIDTPEAARDTVSKNIIPPVSGISNPSSVGNNIFGAGIFGKPSVEPVITKGEAESISAEITESAKNVLELHTPKRKTQLTTGQVNSFTDETIPSVEVPQTKKSADFERRYQRTVENAVASVFGVSRSDIKGDIRPIIEEISADLKAGKEITDGQIDAVYKAAFDDGIISEEFPQYQDTRKYIRSTPIFVDEKTRHEFGDDYAFKDFARSNFGSMKFSTDPRDVHLDEFFDEVSGLAPEFFDGFETDPKSQLESIADFMQQTKKQYYGLSEVYSGSDLADFESWAKKELRNYFEDFKKGIDIVSRYERDRQIRATNKAREMNSSASFDEAKTTMESGIVFEKKKALEQAKARNLLNKNEEAIVDRLLEGTMTEGDVVFQNAGNVEGILEVYRAEKEYKEARAPFDRYSISFKQSMQHDAIEAIKYSDEFEDKDGKLAGFKYQRETPERNVMDITDGGKYGGKEIIEKYITPIHEHEAMATKFINEMNQRVRDLGIGHMNQYERAYIQMIGENSVYLAEGRITKHSQAEHDLLNEKIQNLLNEHGDKIDKEKCEKAAAGFMEIYEELHQKWNDERIRLGQEPVGYIEAYFPHFETAKPETKLQKFFSNILGMEIGSSKLPTEISGRTVNRKPRSKWNPHSLQRKGDLTEYDVLKGFDGYLRVVAHNIYHTEDIMKLRALNESIRSKYSAEDETAKRMNEIYKRKDLSDEDKMKLAAEVLEKTPDEYHLSNFVAWLDDYTNIVAGKKSYGDREAEVFLGREMYDLSKALEGRIAANMIGYNVSTPIMNLVPLFQAVADVSPVDIVSSVMQTGIGALKKDSYISGNSDFVTNRLGTDSLYKQNYGIFESENMRDFVAKVQDGGAFGMELVDRIVSESLVRARVTQNIRDRGMNTEEAFAEADKWAAGLIADRSLGAMPTFFEKKNPLVKALSMFQIEVNNQYSYILKDAGKYKIDSEGKASTVLGQLAFWTAMAICNALGDEILGRDNIVPDPIGITADFIEKLQKGEPVGNVLFDTSKEVLEQMPFVGSLMGGGRIPLSSAVPDFEKLSAIFNVDTSPERRGQIILASLGKPLSYILAPSGAGMLWKTGQGINQLIQGGAYGVTNEGKYLKFPQEYDPESIIKTVLFGQYASDRGQQYIDSGFRDKLSAKQTEQMETAEKWGISNEEFYDLVLGLKPYDKKEEKLEALFENENFTAGEKGILEQILFGTDHKPYDSRDYSDKESFYVSGLTETEKRLYEEGFYGGELDRLEKAIKSGDKKEDQIANIKKELNCSEAEAFEILQKRNGEWVKDVPEDESARAQGAADFYGMSTEDYLSVYNYRNFGEKKEEVIENLMAAKGWDRETAEENWNKVFLYDYSREDLSEKNVAELDTSQSWYEVDDHGYFTARNILKTVEGEKDEFGNTVSGSKKAAAISAIAEALDIDEDEAAIYYLAANGDLALSASDLSSAKQADLATAVSYGWTERQFLDAVNIIKLSGATKKDDIINALMEAGAPYEMAIGYYNLSKNYDYWKR